MEPETGIPSVGEQTDKLKTILSARDLTSIVFAGVPMRILLALSAYSNGQKILNTNRTPGTLDCVHGIRFLSMTWVILGHTLVFFVNLISEYHMRCN